MGPQPKTGAVLPMMLPELHGTPARTIGALEWVLIFVIVLHVLVFEIAPLYRTPAH
jgi:hypothetical protein